MFLEVVVFLQVAAKNSSLPQKFIVFFFQRENAFGFDKSSVKRQPASKIYVGVFKNLIAAFTLIQVFFLFLFFPFSTIFNLQLGSFCCELKDMLEKLIGPDSPEGVMAELEKEKLLTSK